MKILLIVVAVLAVLVLGKVLLDDKDSQPSPSTTATETPDSPAAEVTEESSKADLIQVNSPKTGDQITSPVIITGKARGVWYFEASFPITILDETGRALGRGHAEAKSDWMTSEFVPFTALITFTQPTTKTGTILLEKDNPSGLPEKADSIEILIKF
ncbi:MAG: Gmad2 immunoglobulin-like domain-containing protein [Candidatus Berkelbacteria bacterium]|nr:Gmad2 immunoglobulin-like domain-containing protein [Candidatus Berkelbacteria bacterium]